MTRPKTCSVFVDNVLVARGALDEIVAALDAQGLDCRQALVFDDETGDAVRLNSADDLATALAMRRDLPKPHQAGRRTCAITPCVSPHRAKTEKTAVGARPKNAAKLNKNQSEVNFTSRGGLSRFGS